MKSPEEILAWLQANLNYLEHDKPNERKPENFWPHKCKGCCHSIQTFPCGDVQMPVVDPLEWDCKLNCLRYRDLSLEEYVSLRIEESMK